MISSDAVGAVHSTVNPVQTTLLVRLVFLDFTSILPDLVSFVQKVVQPALTVELLA